MTRLGVDAVPVELPLIFWKPIVTTARANGLGGLHGQALSGISRTQVLNRRLPDELSQAGLMIDPAFTKSDHLNTVLRLTGGESGHVYLKVEGRPEATRAELLASMIWYRLGWKGVGDRCVLNASGDVLIIPPVGGVDGIVDQGPFGTAFGHRPPETPDSLRSERARFVRRVTIEDLKLDDPDDVTRFVAVNGTWGNTDRHFDNVHYGWRQDPDASAGGVGFLLPIDHGRCFFANVPGLGGSSIHGSPQAAVTGKLSNPHQLLRAFTERVRADQERARATIRTTAEAVAKVAEELLLDPAWQDYKPELDAVIGRSRTLATDPIPFIAACLGAVAP